MPAPDGPIVLICGVRADGTLRAVEITDDDFLKMAFAAAAQGLVGTHGWISSAWQKNPLIRGFSDTIDDAVSDTNIGAGNPVLESTAVPAGEIWVITSISYYYSGTVPTKLSIYLYRNTTNFYIHIESPITDKWWYHILRELYMKEDDTIRLLATGATAGDDMYLRLLGYKFDIDQ